MRFSAVFRQVTIITVILPILVSEATADDKWKKIQAEINRIELKINESEFPNMEHYRNNNWRGDYFYYGNSHAAMGSQNVLKVWYYELAGRHWENRLDLPATLSSWKMFKTRSNLITSRGELDEGEVATFYYIKFKSNSIPCTLISSTWGMGFHMGSSRGTKS